MKSSVSAQAFDFHVQMERTILTNDFKINNFKLRKYFSMTSTA